MQDQEKRISGPAVVFLLGISLLWVPFSTFLLAQSPAKPNPSSKEPSDVQSSSKDSTKLTKVVDPKAARAELNKKKAEELLNRCYQSALGTPPYVKAEALNRIGQSMHKIDQQRAAFIFQQAFEATGEIQDPTAVNQKAMLQFNIVMSEAAQNTEKALQMALNMDRIYPSGQQGTSSALNMRNNALAMVASRMATKDPDRAFEVVENQIAEGNFEPSFIAPVAMQLRKSRPEQAEQLFVEAINQFDRPSHEDLQIQNFANLTSRLFDLNHALSAKALDLIIKAEDELEKKQQDSTTAFAITTTGSNGPRSVSSVREFVALQAVAMMRRLDPERAKELQEKYAQFSHQFSSFPNGFFPIGDDADAQTGNVSTNQQLKTTVASSGGPAISSSGSIASGSSGPASTSPSSTETDRMATFVIKQSNTSGGTNSPPKLDPGQLAAQLQSQMQADNAVRTAANNPQAGVNAALQIESPVDKAKALARIAASIYKSDPEKSKSLLGDAYTMAEKISDPFDHAEVYAYISDGYRNFDLDKARSILTEALTLADKVLDDEANAPSTTPFSKSGPDFRLSSQLYEMLLSRLARFNIGEAMNKADQINDPRTRLMTLINMADYVLNDGESVNPGFQIYLR